MVLSGTGESQRAVGRAYEPGEPNLKCAVLPYEVTFRSYPLAPRIVGCTI